MYPTLFTIGRFAVPSYTVLLDVGLILALVLAYVEGRRVLGSGETALDAGLWAIVGGILGGRVGFVLANVAVFREEPVRALRVWEGGLAFHGAFLGGLAAFALVAASGARRDPRGAGPAVLRLADVLTPGLAVGLTLGWVACLLYGSAYGATGSGVGTAVLPDVTGVEARRYATQAFAIGQSLLLLGLVWALRRRWPFYGAAFLMFNLLYFAGQFLLEYFRGDETLYWAGWRLTHLLDLALALLAAVALLVLWARVRSGGAPGLLPVSASDEPEPETGEEIDVAEDAGEDTELEDAGEDTEPGPEDEEAAPGAPPLPGLADVR